MSRVQLALNVSDLDEAVGFYSKLFATEPAKRRPGYANFAIAEPPLKLVLIEGGGEPGSLNHLGVEVASTDEVAAANTATHRSRAWRARPKTRSRAALRCRTRSGSTPPTESRGRSTRCSPMPRCPPASSGAWTQQPTRCAAAPHRSPLLAAAERCHEGLARRLTAEAVGTGFLVAAVVGSGIAAQRLSPTMSVSSCSRTRSRPVRRWWR